MKNEFVAEGHLRFLRGKKAAAFESIEKKYSAELAKADPAEKRPVPERMAAALFRREKISDHKPSPATLW